MTPAHHQQLLRGTVDILILKALSKAPMHGFGISRWIRDTTEHTLALEDAGLYQALHRLENKRWIKSHWGVSENNRRAKYYQLTAKGRKRLQTEVKNWQRYADAVFKVVKA